MSFVFIRKKTINQELEVFADCVKTSAVFFFDFERDHYIQDSGMNRYFKVNMRTGQHPQLSQTDYTFR